MILQTVRQLHCVLVLASCLLQMKAASGQGWQGQFGIFSEMWWAEAAAHMPQTRTSGCSSGQEEEVS